MTQQVRTGYRNHRKAAWGIALLFAAAVAAITIPLASGAPTKTLKFVAQPPASAEQHAATPADFSVAVFIGRPEPDEFEPAPTPFLNASGAERIDCQLHRLRADLQQRDEGVDAGWCDAAF